MPRRVRHLDLPRGQVPDYRAFVRHLWSFGGDAVSAPPCMYKVLLRREDPEWHLVRRIALALSAPKASRRGRVAWVRSDSDRGLWELQFGDLQSLHGFCVAMAAASRRDRNALSVVEFILWTLGVRWS